MSYSKALHFKNALTGEVMGVGRTFAEAFAKAQLGSNSTMKKQGRALLSVREGDKERVVDLPVAAPPPRGGAAG
ncbi:hypothetical protein O9C21_29065 (plasmid) [Klebsiella pneumoniae]|nr:hypothetical protein [Klebsiella pneumoniae]MDB2259145.1 hypothetical protein [Klebsiella pneumoniae]